MSPASLAHPARVVVVGTGPAGVRAAQALVQAGLRPVVVDEGRRDGGQIYRRQPEGFKRPYAKLYGSEAEKAQALHRDFDALRDRIDYRPDTLAWNLSERELHAVREGEPQTLPFDALLVCSGATDRLMPVPGWQRAGLLQPRRRADRAQGAGLRDRLARRLPRQRAAAVPGRRRSTCRPARRSRRCSTRRLRPSPGAR